MAGIVGAIPHVAYQLDAPHTIFNGASRHLTVEYASWVWFYSKGMLIEDSFNKLNDPNEKWRPWRLSWNDYREWYPEAPITIAEYNRDTWNELLEFWHQQVFCHPLYYVKKTPDMGFGLFARDTIAYGRLIKEIPGFLELVNLQSNPWAKKIPSVFVDREGTEYILFGPLSLVNNNVDSCLHFTNLNEDGRTFQYALERHSVAYMAVDIEDDMEIVEERCDRTMELRVVDESMVNEELASTQDVNFDGLIQPHLYVQRKTFYALRVMTARKADDSMECKRDDQILVNYQ